MNCPGLALVKRLYFYNVSSVILYTRLLFAQPSSPVCLLRVNQAACWDVVEPQLLRVQAAEG